MEVMTMFTKSITNQKNGLNVSWVEHIINSIRPTLPIQNPMPFFVHNNPIQYWEKFPFEVGIENAVLTFENTGEHKSRVLWRELEDFVLPIVISYFDQGLNRWNLESHKTNLWQWFVYNINSSLNIKAQFLSELKSSIKLNTHGTLLEDTTKILEQRCANKEIWLSHLQALILHFKGWSGMIQVLEKDASLFPLVSRNVSLIDWVAILVFTENAINFQKEKPWWGKPLWSSAPLEPRIKEIHNQLNQIKEKEKNFYQSFFNQFQSHLIATLQQRSTLELSQKSGPITLKSSEQIKSTPTVHTNWVKNKIVQTPLAQILFCLDDREESLRRAIESTNQNYETFGTLGFYGIDFSLKRPGHLIFQPHCPPVIQAKKKAEEVVPLTSSLFKKIMQKLLPLLNESRFTFLEPLIAICFWPIYASLLIIRSLSPSLYSQFRNYFQTDLYINSMSSINFITEYTIKEKADIVAGILGGAGLLNVTAPLVVVMGHAATTTNNPFQKSYGCGACSGQSGFSNAKVFVEFANDDDVRVELKVKGININPKVTFIAACHDTSRDQTIYAHQNETYLGVDQEKKHIYFEFQKNMNLALKINKEERWKQFQLSSFESAESRSSDWSQPRPEFGHTGISLTVFGPRWLTKDLNLNRRAFLMSYDPDLDPTGEHLSYVILNALPVCANINLDYFTSAAFPEAFGAGSKLPLNIASGIGLMAGSKGDLRVGLATQMIDRHEPLRLLAYVYADKLKLEQSISSSPRLQNIIKNNWIHLVRIDPLTLKFEFVTDELKRDFNYDSTLSI